MLKIIAIALICAVIIIYLKSINSELSLLATIGSGIIIIFLAVDYMANTFEFINKLINISGISADFYKILFKITAIGYLIEFGADTINDFGLTSLSNKLIFVGKLIIFNISLPIFYAVFNLLIGLLK